MGEDLLYNTGSEFLWKRGMKMGGQSLLGKTSKFDKNLIAVIMPLAWPTILEQALQTVVQFIDSAMVGRISANASAAVGLTQTVTWLLNGLLFAAGVGFLAVISRAIGGEDRDRAQKAAGQAVLAAVVMGMIIGIIGVAISPVLPVWLGGAPEIQRDAATYFMIINIPMLFRSATILFGAVLRATGDMRHPMLVNALMNGINVVLNFLLIYPSRQMSLFGLEFSVWGAGMGVAGAATATAISYVIGGMLMTGLLLKSDRGVSPNRESLRPDREILKRCLQISIPNAAERTVVSLGSTVFTAMVASLGTIPLAAHSIAITAESAFYVPGYGFQAAATTLSGLTLGEGDQDKLDRMSETLMRITVFCMFISGMLLFLFPGALMSFFTNDPQVIEQGAVALRIVSVSEPFFAVTLSLEGVFNGVGDTKMPFVISLCSMWGVRILFTFLCVNVWGLGLAAVWMCMIADVITRSICMYTRYRRGRWKQGLFDHLHTQEAQS